MRIVHKLPYTHTYNNLIMKLISITICIICLVLFYEGQCSSVQSISSGVYWRDYTGVVPEDAIPGGYDVNQEITYIGQGFVKNRGIIPGVIYPGVKQMTVPIYGTQILDAYVKILCSSDPTAFQWIPTKISDFHLGTNNNYVIGGEEDGHLLLIGRVAYQGEVITGKIFTETTGKALLYFAHKTKEIKMDSYEVLVLNRS